MNTKYFLYTENISHHRKVKEIKQISPINRECYSSLFSYDRSIINSFDNNGSIREYKDGVYGEYFVLDIDGKDLKQLITDMKPLLEKLKDFTYYIFFSGKKGFHIYIPKDYVIYPKNYINQWNYLSKLFAEEIIKEFPKLIPYIDFSIYDRMRMFRLPFSIHPKSGKKKSLMKYLEFNEDDPMRSFGRRENNENVILTKILEGQEIQIEINMYTLTVKEEKKIVSSVIGKNYLNYPYGKKICIYKMLNSPEIRGKRHQIGLRLQSYWAEEGYTKDFIQVLLEQWNERLQEPISSKEIANITKYQEKGYIYTCQDSIKKAFCEHFCKYYQSNDIEDDSIFNSKNSIDKVKVQDVQSDEHFLDLSIIYPEWNIRPFKPSYIIVIAAGAGVGKTTLLLNIMVANPHLNWLFFSMDMDGIGVVEKLLSILDLSKEQKEKYEKLTNHITIFDKPAINMEKIKDYIDLIEQREKKQFQIVAFDYIGLLKSKGASKTERTDYMATEFKTIAKETKKIFINLAQVPKGIAGDGNQKLGLDAPKDSGEIANSADCVLTCWRPYKNTNNIEADTIFTIGNVKNRHDVDGYDVNLDWIGDGLKIKTRTKQ